MRTLTLFSCIFVALLAGTPRESSAQAPALPDTALSLETLDAFRPVAANWSAVGDVDADRQAEQTIDAEPGTGVLLNRPTDTHRDNLFTTWNHGDLELNLEFMMPAGSNSGIYLQGRYEVQLFDSWGVRAPRFSDVGGIYQRWDESRPEGQQGYEGIPPRQNAARAPGLWQHLRIVFQAPRFDDQGRKVANARFLEVVLNGVTVQENVEVTGPTRAAAFEDEQPLGPLMIQGDHGPVAFRDIRYKRFDAPRVRLSDVRHRYYEGEFDALPDFATLSPQIDESREGLSWRLAPGQGTFAAQVEGTVHIPTTGSYRFYLGLYWLTSDPHFSNTRLGGGLLTIDEQTALTHEGRQRIESGLIDLEAGTYPFTLAYFNNRGRFPLMTLAVEGPAMPRHTLNAPGTLPEGNAVAPIIVEPQGEPVVLRSMIRFDGEKRTRAVSVGDPTGVHYTLDLDRGALLYAWRGDFVDATPMWHSRGEDQLALPLGSVLRLSGASPLVPSEATSSPPPALDLHLSGYDLDLEGRPTFRYRAGPVTFEDQIVPEADRPVLARTIRFHAETPPASLWYRVAAGDSITRLPDGAFVINDKGYFIEIHEGADPVVRTHDDRQELLLPVPFTDGQATLRYSIIW